MTEYLIPVAIALLAATFIPWARVWPALSGVLPKSDARVKTLGDLLAMRDGYVSQDKPECVAAVDKLIDEVVTR